MSFMPKSKQSRTTAGTEIKKAIKEAIKIADSQRAKAPGKRKDRQLIIHMYIA